MRLASVTIAGHRVAGSCTLPPWKNIRTLIRDIFPSIIRNIRGYRYFGLLGAVGSSSRITTKVFGHDGGLQQIAEPGLEIQSSVECVPCKIHTI